MVEPESTRRPSEVRQMVQPALDALSALVRRAHWPIAALFVVYLFSGVTAVKANEVAIVLRFGRIVGASPGEQIHTAGLLWALPRPIDQVVRVPIDRVNEVEIADLWQLEREAPLTADGEEPRSIDPEEEGYCLTGDQNIVQLQLLARYRVLDPVAHALHREDPEALLRDVVLAETVRASGRAPINAVLSEERKVLGNTVRALAQARLDAAGAGLELIAVEIADFAVPAPVSAAFVDVTNAYIDARRTALEALRYRETELPKAESDRDQLLADARIYAAGLVAEARGNAEAFVALAAEYRKEPRVVVERLYLEGVERVLSKAGRRRLVQPPVGDEYGDFRITISAER